VSIPNPDDFKESSSVTSVADRFPEQVLPPIPRQMVDEVAQVSLVPLTLPACCVLATVSAALGAGLAIPSDRARKTYGNIYVIAGAQSGSGKSLTYDHVMRPVYAYQEDLREQAQAAHYQLKPELLRLRASLKNVEKGNLIPDDVELIRLLKRKDEIEAELRRRPKIVSEDATPEKQQVILAANNECGFSASADARHAVQAVLKAKGDNVYLKAWSGDPTDVDRISRDEVPLKAPRMTVLWLPQPDLLRDMFATRNLSANGFLPRVLACEVDCPPMETGNKTRRVDEGTEKAWQDLVRDLFATYHTKRGKPFAINRARNIQDMMTDYYDSVVKRRRRDLADVGPYAARWAEQAWRLLVVLHAGWHGAEAHNESVRPRTAEDALLLADWFSRQQLELLHCTRAKANKEAEKEIFQLLAVKIEITARDVLRERIANAADEAKLLLEQMEIAGKICFEDRKPKHGGHMARYYRRCDTRDTRDARHGNQFRL